MMEEVYEPAEKITFAWFDKFYMESWTKFL